MTNIEKALMKEKMEAAVSFKGRAYAYGESACNIARELAQQRGWTFEPCDVVISDHIVFEQGVIFNDKGEW